MSKEINRSGEKLGYSKPILTNFGDVRTVTLEPSNQLQFEDAFDAASRREESSGRGGRRGSE